MNWGSEDFAAAAAILIAVAAGVWLVLCTVRSQPARGVMIAMVILAALAVWAHLAVGVF